MKKVNKLPNSQPIVSNLSGGVNNSQPAEMINDNEMQLCENMEYDLTRKLKTRGGVSAPLINFDYPISAVYYDEDMNTYFVFQTNGEMYTTNLYSKTLIGTLTGSKRPICIKYGGKIIIASGGKLNSYEYPAEGQQHILTTLSSSPQYCDIVFEKRGRVGAINFGEDDKIYFSAIGDETNWVDNPDDDSSGKWIEVGYKDSGKIVSISKLADDIIVFKSNGKVYQVSNDYPDWQVYEVGTKSDCITHYATTNIGNDVVFLSLNGLRSLAGVAEFGNIKSNDIGDQFNSYFINNIQNPIFWHLKRKKQLICRSNSSKNEVGVYHYIYNTATVLKFPFIITDIIESPTEVIIASGYSLYEWSTDYETDVGTGTTIVSKIIPKKLTMPYYKTLDMVDISIYSKLNTGVINLNINNTKSVNLTWGSSKRIRYRTNFQDYSFNFVLTSEVPLAISQLVFYV